MAEDNKILEAVNQLDGKNDNHWTADGLPRLETVRMLASDTSLTREQVNEAAPDVRRPAADTTPAAPTPPAPPSAPPAPPAPATTPADGASTTLDTGVRGTIGAPPPEVPAVPAVMENVGGPVPPEDVDGNALPQPDPLPTAPAADGLPTVNEPTSTEGAPGVGMNVDDVSGRSGPHGDPTPEIAKGTSTLGYNAINSPEDDLRDALASVAPSPNAPASLGGPKDVADLDGINADGLSAAVDATGEAQLPSLDRGHPGDPDAVVSLQAELEEAQAASDKLRGQADKLNAKLNEASLNESRIRAAIEAATPRTGHMEAIQGYFSALDRTAEDQAAARKAITDSGLNLTELARLTQRSPLDASFAPAS